MGSILLKIHFFKNLPFALNKGEALLLNLPAFLQHIFLKKE